MGRCTVHHGRAIDSAAARPLAARGNRRDRSTYGLGGRHAAAYIQDLRHADGDERLVTSAFEHRRLVDREPDPDREQSQSALPLVVGRPWWTGYLRRRR